MSKARGKLDKYDLLGTFVEDRPLPGMEEVKKGSGVINDSPVAEIVVPPLSEIQNQASNDDVTDTAPQEDSIEDNLPLVNYIMLHRIYDVLLLLANSTDPDKAVKMVELHTKGQFVGPPPAYASDPV